MRRAAVLGVVAVGLALVAGGCGGGTTTVTVTTTRTVTVTAPAPPPSSSASPCGAAQLSGTFEALPNSQGAGNIVYRLRLVNSGSSSCWVSGLPQAQLLDANGGLLPTKVRPARASVTAAKVTLDPNGAATADARFSPDVPGVGDQTQPGKPCEATATTLRVTAPGGGAVDAPISPPTSVCERGQLSFTVYTAA
jgi:hypothetical protein